MKKINFKIILLFAVILAGLLLFELLTVATIDVTMNIDTRQSGRLTAYYARAGEEFSDDRSHSFEIPIEYSKNSYEANFKIAEDSSLLRIDMEAGLERLSTDGVLISYGIIPLVELSVQDMPAVVTNNILIEGAQDSVEIIANGTDPNFTVNIGLTARLVLFAVKFIICTAVAFLAAIIVLNIKNITKSKVFVLLIAAMLTMPAVSYYLLGLQPDASLENETLAERPTFSLAGIADYPRDYDEYYNDYIPYKPQLVELNSLLKYRLFYVADTDEVILGDDGWGFYSDTLRDYRHTDLLTTEQLNKITDSLVQLNDGLIQRGIKLYITLPPNKSTVYGEYMPDAYLVEGDVSRVEQFYNHIKQNTDIVITHDADALIQKKDEHQLYYKMDTHWNNKGGYIGFKTLADSMGLTVPAFEDIDFTESDDGAADLFKFLNIDIQQADKYYVADFMPEIQAEYQAETRRYPFDNVRHYTTDSKNDVSVLMFKDSYADAMEGYLVKVFSESYFVWDQYNTRYIDEFNPDIVVIEVVERNLDRMLAADYRI